ncbi:peptide deformylase [Candidatus Proelusimicrobium volucris]|uniref:peptide deformylase n=1 Tax=Candidatus Proelusimicrobium volucris TaxID=3416225 RepID=UPI003D11C06F
MAILKIYKYGEDILSKKTRRVNFNLMEKKLPKIINDMTQTCLAMNGVGLAAPQVGLDLSIAVVMYPLDDEGEKYKRYVLINPEISRQEGSVISNEGCLSFPGLDIKVNRAQRINVKYINEKGMPVEIRADGFLAIIMQHEIDHLNGRVFIDLLPPAEKAEAKKKLELLAEKW